MRARKESRALEWAKRAGGAIVVYLILLMVLTFLLESQPSSFIYVSF